MREILFRGKTNDGEWVAGSLLQADPKKIVFPEIRFYYEYEKGKHCLISREVTPETVGQYTGLTDKNGKKIFEGDIFKFNDEVFESYYTSCGTEYNSWEVENYGVVGFCEHSGRFDFVEYKFNENCIEADLHENNDLDFAEFVSELEIIGNIHDNPELLEEGIENDN